MGAPTGAPFGMNANVYRCEARHRFLPVLLTLASAVLLALCVFAPFANARLSHGGGLGVMAGCALFLLGTTLAGIWFLSEASAIYSESAEGLTKQTWFGVSKLKWQNLVGLQIRIS